MYGQTTVRSHRLILAVFVHWSHFKITARRLIQVTNYRGRVPLGQEANIFLFCRFFCRILPLKYCPRSSVRFYIRANDSQFTSTDLAVFVHLSHFKNHGKTSDSSDKLQGPSPLTPGSEYFLFCRFFSRILPLKCWPRSSVRFYIRVNFSHFTPTDLAVFVHLSHFEETARRLFQVTNYRGRVPLGQEANTFYFAASFVGYCR